MTMPTPIPRLSAGSACRCVLCLLLALLFCVHVFIGSSRQLPSLFPTRPSASSFTQPLCKPNMPASRDCKNVVIEKPFQRYIDKYEVVVEAPEIDQWSELCPLEYKSSSKQTGCLCDFATFTINCIYTNKLSQFPKFVETSSSVSASSNDSTAKAEIIWNIDLRCKNLTRIGDFLPLFVFSDINYLDLSTFNSSSACKLGEKESLASLVQVGNAPKPIGRSKANESLRSNSSSASSSPSKSLRIRTLNLKDNKIRDVYLNDDTSLADNKKLYIQQLDLANNQIETLNKNFNENLDPCSLDLKALNLSNNQLKELDVSLFIFLTSLDLSQNQIAKFQISYFDKIKSNAKYSAQCLSDRIHLIRTESSATNGSNETTSLEANSTTPQATTTMASTEPTRKKPTFLYESSLKRLNMSNNRLIYLPFLYLSEKIIFKSVEVLHVDNNLLKTLNLNQFVGMANMSRLTASSNRINFIDEQAFKDLPVLSYLDLSRNLLTAENIDPSAFKSQHRHLKTLFLNGNQLGSVPRGAFRYLTALKYLTLNENKITRLHNYSFGFMYNLLELDLSNNLIETIELHAFEIDERAVLGPGFIEKLDLSYNRLEYLNASVFAYLTNLRYLMLNNNRIRSIDKSAFHGIGHLISLDLNLNLLDDLAFLLNNGTFQHLRYLKLSNNELSHLKPNQFIYLSSLNTLDLSANKIESLADCSFYGIEANIRKLYLNYNQIYRLNSCAFMMNFMNLRFVQIRHNPLDCSTNCEFFFTVYNRPYSVNYEGIECESSAEKLRSVTTKNSTRRGGGSAHQMRYCSQSHYEKISLRCQKKLKDNKCFRLTVNESLLNQEMVEAVTWKSDNQTSSDYQTLEETQLDRNAVNDTYDYELEFAFDANRTLINRLKQSLLKEKPATNDHSAATVCHLVQTLLVVVVTLLLQKQLCS